MAELMEGGVISSHNLTTETPIDIDEMIYMYTQRDLPLLGGINNDGMAILPRKPLSNVFFDWMEEETPLPNAILAEDLDGSETAIDVGAGEATGFKAGDLIRIDDEVMLVTDVDLAGDELTVTRGSAGL